jgi:hypothetical protein
LSEQPKTSDLRTESISWKIYVFAEQLMLLRYRAEVNWCGDKFQGTPIGVAKAVTSLKAIAVSLKSDLAELPSLSNFETAVSKFWTAYLKGWRSSERENRLSETRDPDSEFEFSRHCYLLKGSPLQKKWWPAVVQAAEEVAKAAGPDDRHCYSLSLLLNAEIYGTITGGERLRDPDHELEYLTGDFASKVRASLEMCVNAFPYLDGCRLDVADCDEHTLLNRVVDLSHRVRDSLRDPARIHGFLDLELDRRNGRVGRRGKSEMLASNSTRWPVLIKLAKNHEGVTGTRNVVKLLEGSVPKAVSDGAASQAVSELRKVLRPLGVRIKTEKRLGWRLIESKDLPKKRRRKRR